ncbi:type VI secretion system lipoprotein TssJ [Nitrosomonas sp.]|uniref:type VI secretion system lipoprotein TssJ n=1 Tax=Nitrosomonas sp. TaxID=42353 RepID=UPI00284BCC75|nr:type VI secretion system lipoprotein TssJ [Nitrosomonas sp.]MDR4515601.1 type VI secretion system lipoprotein TssJ [Nitrosomonas sp.]
MKPLPKFYYAASISLFLFLSGCSSTPKPPIARISLNVQKDINLYCKNVSKSQMNTQQINSPSPYCPESSVPEARPVVIRLYELRSLAAFNSTDFLSVFNDFNAALGNELLFSEELRLIPGMRHKYIRPLNFDTRYIGVVAAFRDLEHAQWRTFTPIPPQEKAPQIYIFVKENTIMTGAKSPCGFFCRMWTPQPPAGTLYEMIE